MRALVLESSEHQQEFLPHLITNRDIEITLVNSDSELVVEAAKNLYDLIIIPMQYNSVFGPVLCKKIRGSELNARTTIIIIALRYSKNHYEQALIAGANEIFHKNNVAELYRYISDLALARITDASHPGKILYIDTVNIQPLRLDHTVRILEKNGHKVVHTLNIGDSIKAFSHHQFDLILANLPESTLIKDFESLQRSLLLSGKSDLPILTIADFKEPELISRILDNGASDYITRPVIEKVLQTRIKQHLLSRKLLEQLESQRRPSGDEMLRDHLTGLYNRHFLMELIPQKIREAVRHQIDVSLLVLDLDHFRKINQEHGHPVGDEILKKVSVVLANACRDEDIAARFGGEEFVILLSHCNSKNAAKKAETIRKRIASLNPCNVPVSISIGVTELSTNQSSEFHELFEAATNAVYKAKKNGRNRVEFCETRKIA